MNLFSTLEHYLNMFMVVSLIVLALSAVVIYYLLRVKKVSSAAEKINYAGFKRIDAMEFVKFEDIVSETDDYLSGAGMICLGKNTFVGAISIQGFNYFSASTDEKVNAMLHSLSFTNVIEDRITLRQSVQAIDLSDNIGQHEEIAANITLELMALDDEYQSTLSYAEDYVDDVDTLQIYNKKLESLQRQIQAKRHMLKETQALIAYMNSMVSDGNKKKKKDSQVSSQLIFSYIFDPNSVTEDLTKEEIYVKAFGELNLKANAYMGALASCGCSCKRMSAGELTLLMRKQCAPVSGEDFKLEELFESSYTSMFITCDSLINMVKKKIGEERFEEELREYERRLLDAEKMQQVNALRLERVALENALTQVQEEVE